MFTSFQYSSDSSPILPDDTILRAERLHSNCSIYPVNRETCKDCNLLRPFEISNYHLVVISSANNHCHAVSQLNSLSAVYMHSMSGYVMSKDGRKISTIHLTLKAGVRHKERKMGA